MSLTAVNAGAYLHHMAIESDRPDELAAFYASTLDMDAEKAGRDEWHCEGPGRRIVFRKGMPKRLAATGFACRDREGLEGLRERAAAERLAIENAQDPFFGEEAFAVRDADGNVVAFGLSKDGDAGRKGLRGPLQHLALATFNVTAQEDFYHGRLGFAVSDRVVRDGETMTSFMRSNHEHHTVACFRSNRIGLDHHSYEASEWDTIRDWADRFADRRVPLMWGPGRHGPGNNLFIFIEDPDGNWIEISAELEVVHDRPVKEWPHEERTLNLWGKAIMRA